MVITRKVVFLCYALWKLMTELSFLCTYGKGCSEYHADVSNAKFAKLIKS